MDLNKAIEQLKQAIKEEGIESENGLGTDLFLFATTLIPIVNVDILLVDNDNRFILSWRDDKYCGVGWHVPGGCIRLRETMQERVHACAIEEFGVDVDFISQPILVSEGINIATNIKERCHFISILYICKSKKLSGLKNLDAKHIAGHLYWFTKLPDDFIDVQYFYKDNWSTIKKKMEEINNV